MKPFEIDDATGATINPLFSSDDKDGSEPVKESKNERDLSPCLRFKAFFLAFVLCLSFAASTVAGIMSSQTVDMMTSVVSLLDTVIAVKEIVFTKHLVCLAHGIHHHFDKNGFELLGHFPHGLAGSSPHFL